MHDEDLTNRPSLNLPLLYYHQMRYGASNYEPDIAVFTKLEDRYYHGLVISGTFASLVKDDSPALASKGQRFCWVDRMLYGCAAHLKEITAEELVIRLLESSWETQERLEPS
jgi:hypothetical protein